MMNPTKKTRAENDARGCSPRRRSPIIGARRLAAGVLALLPATLALGADASIAAAAQARTQEGAFGPTTAEILERFDRSQRETRTLVARFIEQKHVRLLARPLVSQGRFFFDRPNQVRREYDDPERKVFVITEDHYVAYYPTDKRAEDVDLKKVVGKRLGRGPGGL